MSDQQPPQDSQDPVSATPVPSAPPAPVPPPDQAYTQPYGQQPYPQQPAAQPYSQPYGQPYTQPVAQPYHQPYGQPYGVVPPPIVPTGPTQVDYGYNPGFGGRMPGQTSQVSTNAIVAFVLALVGLLMCPIVPSIVALVLASMATKEIDASGGWRTGQSFVTAAKVISWIGLGLWGLFLLAYGAFAIIIIVIAATNPSSGYDGYNGDLNGLITLFSW